MSAPFTIDIWSDVICPFCYLAERYLELALERFVHRDDVVIAFHAFELDVRARASYDQPLAELVARKYDIARSQADAFHASMRAEAAGVGLQWNFESARAANTFDAHRLVALAREQSLGARAVHRLFVAYFEEGALLSDHDTLARLGEELGLEGVRTMLGSNQYGDLVRAEELEALELGIGGVPAMLIDGRFMVHGARPVEELLEVLNRAWARREKIYSSSSEGTTAAVATE